MSRIQAIDTSVDLLQSLLWQYNDAEILQSLLQSKQDWYNTNQSEFWNDWIIDVFDLRTANDFGLSVWAIILDIPLTVSEGVDPPGKKIWGFGPYRRNFDNGNFARNPNGVFRLTTEQKRIVLQLRYFQLVSRGTAPEINYFLQKLFKDQGKVYVTDSLDMSIALYIFLFYPSSQLQFILMNYDLLPRPAGVGVGYQIITKVTWGFGPYHRNFDNGNFI